MWGAFMHCQMFPIFIPFTEISWKPASNTGQAAWIRSADTLKLLSFWQATVSMVVTMATLASTAAMVALAEVMMKVASLDHRVDCLRKI